MDQSLKIFALLIVSLATVTTTTANSGNNQLSDEDLQIIVVVKDLESLKTLIGEISQVQGMNADYDGVLNRQIVEKSLEQVNYEVPQNSYALVIRTKDVPSTQAVANVLEQYTKLTGINISITVGRRQKRISGLISVGTALVAVIKSATSYSSKGTDPYGKQLLSAASLGLAAFSAGMAAVSLIPNPLTPSVSAIAGAVSLGLDIAKEKIY